MLPTKSTFDDYVKKGLVRSQTYKDMTIYQYTEFTPKRVWEALYAGQRIDRMNIPEEFIKWLDDTEKELLLKYNELFDKINQALADTINMTNKEIYMEIKTESNSPYKKDGTFKKDKHLEEQAEMLENLRARGYRAEFGVGFDKCKQIIDEYLRR